VFSRFHPCRVDSQKPLPSIPSIPSTPSPPFPSSPLTMGGSWCRISRFPVFILAPSIHRNPSPPYPPYPPPPLHHSPLPHSPWGFGVEMFRTFAFTLFLVDTQEPIPNTFSTSPTLLSSPTPAPRTKIPSRHISSVRFPPSSPKPPLPSSSMDGAVGNAGVGHRAQCMRGRIGSSPPRCSSPSAHPSPPPLPRPPSSHSPLPPSYGFWVRRSAWTTT
jgi:hypothetical protein